ncbi:MAG: T9SS type A sorting domain-containing protein, partial [Mucilaginibacter sp.]
YEIPNIYNGIDLHYYSNENGLKMYYVIKPFYEHSVSDIKWLIKGASTTTISDTYLKIGGFNDTVIFDAPYAYQVTTSLTCVPLTSAAWTQVGTDTFAITTSSYNPALPLVLEIDYGNTPISVASSIANLSQSTFYGSNRDDGIRDIDVDPVTGNFAALFGIDGYGMTHEFPATTGTLSIAADSVAGQCLGIVVFDKNEIRKTVNTYGVKARDLGPMSIALQGNLVTVVGNLPNFIDVSLTAPDNYSVLPSYTSTGPLTAGTYSNHGGPGFALQFRQDPVTGSANKLLWKTWLNGYASDMDKTPDGKFLYLTTSSSDGFTPHTKTKSGAYNNSAFPIYGVPSFQLWKFDSLGVEQWSSIFPAVNTTFHKATPMPVSPDYWNNGSGLNTLEWDEYPKCKIACDNYGFSLAGEVDTVGLLTFSRYGAPLTSSWGGGNDAFFARFNKSDSLVYCSYVSGANNEGYRAIAPLGSKEAVMVGYSNSKNKQKITTNPATGFYVDSTNTSNNYKILYTKFDTTGVKVHSTFYGANTSHVFAQGVTTDGGSRVFITGRDLGGFTLTVTNPANTYNVSARTSTEAFMLAFDWNQPIWNTEFGGAHEDIGTCLAYNPKMIDYASLILAGVTTSDYGSSDPPDFPIAASFVGGYFQEYHNSDFYYDMYSNLYVFPSTEADGFLAFFDQSKVIGIEEFFKDKTADIDIWNLFPNPTQNIAYVAFKTELKGDVKIEVRNQLGQLLHSEVRRDILAHTIVNLDTHGFKDGIYFVSLDNGQTLTTKKLVITK